MGGSSNGSSNGSSTTSYRNTTTTNPYVTSTTTNAGTTTSLNDGTALKGIYDFTNANIANLLNEYLNPSTDTATNRAKMETYADTLNTESRKALENNVIAPLTQRNMLRSAQATNLYRDLANQQTKGISDYSKSLIADSQNNTGNVLNTLMNLAFQGYNVIQGNQAQSLQTSAGNASKTTSGNQHSTSWGL